MSSTDNQANDMPEEELSQESSGLNRRPCAKVKETGRNEESVGDDDVAATKPGGMAVSNCSYTGITCSTSRFYQQVLAHCLYSCSHAGSSSVKGMMELELQMEMKTTQLHQGRHGKAPRRWGAAHLRRRRLAAINRGHTQRRGKELLGAALIKIGRVRTPDIVVTNLPAYGTSGRASEVVPSRNDPRPEVDNADELAVQQIGDALGGVVEDVVEEAVARDGHGDDARASSVDLGFSNDPIVLPILLPADYVRFVFNVVPYLDDADDRQ